MLVDQIIIGMILALFAGLSTVIGAMAIFFISRPNKTLLSVALGFSAGVMISVSIFELIPTALISLNLLTTAFMFILGIAVVMFIDFIIPHKYEREGISCRKETGCSDTDYDYENKKLMRTGVLLALGIAIHNLPEGLVTLSGSLESTRLGVVLAIAIAMHNIPEGFSIAVPIYASTGKRRKAFFLSLLSGLAEPLGAAIGLVILLPFLETTFIVDYTLAFVAGIMIFISLDELLPCAYGNCNGDDSHKITAGILFGMVLMIATLVILEP